MCCDHCHREIAPGTERTIWDGVKRWVRVCALCLPFVVSVTFGETSPAPEPPPLLRFTRSPVFDSSSRSIGSGVLPMMGELNGNTSCPVSVPSASFTCPTQLPEGDGNEPEHLPEESGSTINPINSSGMISNVQAHVTMTSWEPPDRNHSAMDRFFLETDLHGKYTTLKVGSIHAQRPMPRARRSCWVPTNPARPGANK
jgi:hypothetical protein